MSRQLSKQLFAFALLQLQSFCNTFIFHYGIHVRICGENRTGDPTVLPGHGKFQISHQAHSTYRSCLPGSRLHPSPSKSPDTRYPAARYPRGYPCCDAPRIPGTHTFLWQYICHSFAPFSTIRTKADGGIQIQTSLIAFRAFTQHHFFQVAAFPLSSAFDPIEKELDLSQRLVRMHSLRACRQRRFRWEVPPPILSPGDHTITCSYHSSCVSIILTFLHR